jgi:hypothetical protein
MKIKISFKEIERYLDVKSTEFPKYVAPLINLANQYAGGTRPKVVGKMSELIKQFSGRTLPEWEKWYLKQKPEAIEAATQKILNTLEDLKKAMNKIDKEMVKQWVKDLVIVKTFIGLKFQEIILKKGAEIKRTSYRLSTPEEESKGIDGYIGNVPVSIKPFTYKTKFALPENIPVKIIYYKKLKDGIEVDYEEIL